MKFLRHLFGLKSRNKSIAPQGDAAIESEQQLLAQFTSLDDDSRLMQIITLGDHGDMKNFKLMQYAILSDPDNGVKCAALKRIHLFRSHPDLIPMMAKLKNDPSMEDLEPYFSMALSRLGLISLDEFEKRTGKSD